MRRPHRLFFSVVVALLLGTPAGAGFAEGKGQGQLPPASTAPPTISGSSTAGQTLTANTGSWNGVSLSYAYQWLRCDLSGNSCAQLSGATANTYKLGSADVGTTMRVAVTATNRNGSASATSNPTAVVAAPPAAPPPAPTNTALPQVSGTLQVGQALSATTGSWNGSPTSYAYQWQRCDGSGSGCAAIGGATASSYTLASADAGATLRVAVTATNSGGSTTATSAATGVVAATSTSTSAPTNTALPQITGTTQTGQVLKTSTGTWNGSPSSYGYQWRRCDSTGGACADITGATASSYTLASADVGKTLRATVTATNTSGSGSATSTATAAVTAPSTTTTTTGTISFGVADGADIVYESDATRQRELDSMKAMGAKWVRYDFAWSSIERTKGTFSWGQLDTSVSEAAARGMKVVAMLGYAPSWANGGYTDDKYGPKNAADYGNFAKAVATHFGPLGVHVYEIWNEPNISAFWKPTPDVVMYSAIVKAAYPGIHAADPQATVLAGAMSPHGGYHDTNCNGVADSGRDSTGYDPVDFVIGLYGNGGGGNFDAISMHPYERYIGISYNTCSGWSIMAQTPVSLRSVMTSNNDSAKKIWATEYGNSVPAWTDEAGQASRLTTAMNAWKTYSWAAVFFNFNTWDSHGSYFGLLRSDWSQRPAWTAFKAAAAGY